MLADFLFSLADWFGPFNVFRYLTVKAGLAALTGLFITFVVAPSIIRRLRIGQQGMNTIREDLPDTHQRKTGTPTGGGIILLFSVVISVLLWADLTSVPVQCVMLATLGFGAIGLYDDLHKLSRSKGIRGRVKLVLQLLVASAVVGLYQYRGAGDLETLLAFPFLKDFVLDLGWFFPFFSIFVIVGSGNAVNLTDGLDGLAIVPVMIAAAVFGLIAYVCGNAVLAEYLQIFRVPGAGEASVVCAAFIGAGLGFLWFNAPPAMIFMGDTGALSMGGALGTTAMVTKHEIVLAIVGGVFVLETVSVILQVASFRLTGKRLFAMAPLHHHFEKRGWEESTIVIRFWIIAIILGLIGLSTLKLR